MKKILKIIPLMVCILLLCQVIPVQAAEVNTTGAPAPVLLWSAPTGSTETMSDNAAKVSCSGDGKYVVAGYGAGIVEFRDRQGAVLWKWQSPNPAYTVWQVAVSRNGEHTGILLYDPYQKNMGEINYFNRAGNLLWTKTLKGPFGFEALSGDGNVVAVTNRPGINFLNTSGQVTGTTELDGYPWTIAISDDGSTATAGTKSYEKPGVLYAVSPDGTVRWSSPDRFYMRAVAVSGNGSVIAGAGLNELRYFNRGSKTWSFNSSPEFSGVAVSSDGSYVAAVSQYYLRYFNSSGTKLWQYEVPSFPTQGGPSVGLLGMSADGRYVTASTEGRVLFFGHDGKILWQNSTSSRLVSTSLSQNGKYLAVGTEKEVMYFDTGIDAPVAEPEPTADATTVTQAPGPTPTSTPQASFPGILVVAGICAGILISGYRKK